MINSEQLIQDELARCNCYRLLAACFYQPRKETLIQEGLFENLSLLLRQICPDAAVFSDRMGREIMNYSNEELLVEYARLFVGPFELKAAPYGSVYLDPGKKLMGDSTMEVLQHYKDEGLSIDADFKELPDHIAAELEFMYYLAFKETEALKKGETDRAVRFLDAQKEFSRRFMRPWVQVFCDLLKNGTDNSYYQSLAGCLSVFIDKAGDVPFPPESLTMARAASCAQR
ncbi:MAG: TorD/DmsD family molecular chaperone [Thermodesulfovibrionales bacterium]